MKLQMIELNKLVVGQGEWDGGRSDVSELKASIKGRGLLMPLIVQKQNRHFFDVIAGKRRFKALLELYQESGESEPPAVPCIVTAGEDPAEVALVENQLRQGLTPLQEADLYAELVARRESVADIANRFGVSELTVRRRVALSRLIPELRAKLGKGMSLTVAQRASQLSPEKQAELAERNGVIDDWSVSSRLERTWIPAEVAFFDVEASGIATEQLLFPPQGAPSSDGLLYITDKAAFHRLQAEWLRNHWRDTPSILEHLDEAFGEEGYDPAMPILERDHWAVGFEWWHVEKHRPELAGIHAFVTDERDGYDILSLPLTAEEFDSLEQLPEDARVEAIEKLCGETILTDARIKAVAAEADTADKPAPEAPPAKDVWTRNDAPTQPLRHLVDAWHLWLMAAKLAIEPRHGIVLAGIMAGNPSLCGSEWEGVTHILRNVMGKEAPMTGIFNWLANVLFKGGPKEMARQLREAKSPIIVDYAVGITWLKHLVTHQAGHVMDALGFSTKGERIPLEILERLGRAELAAIAKELGMDFDHRDKKGELVRRIDKVMDQHGMPRLPAWMLTPDERTVLTGGKLVDVVTPAEPEDDDPLDMITDDEEEEAPPHSGPWGVKIGDPAKEPRPHEIESVN